MNEPNEDRLTRMEQELDDLRGTLRPGGQATQTPSLEDLHEMEGLHTSVRILERTIHRLEAEREASTLGVLTIDAFDRVVGWNRMFLDMWGVKPPVPNPSGTALIEEMAGRCSHPKDLLALFESEALGGIVELSTGMVIQIRVSEIDFDPPARYYEFLDVTQQHRSPSGLVYSETHYRNLIENAPGAMFQVRKLARWQVYAVTPRITAICGHTPEHFIGRRLSRWTELIVDEDRHTFGTALRLALRTGRPFNTEIRIHYKDGGNRLVAMRGTPFRDLKGRIVGFDGLISDITSRREDEDHLRKANAQLRERLEDLDVRTRQLEHLNELGRGLQSARNVNEAVRVFIKTAQQLVPKSTGGVYLVNAQNHEAYLTANWQGAPYDRAMRRLAVRDCYALCLSHSNRPGVAIPESCRSCPNLSPEGQICLPLGHHPNVPGFVYLRPIAGHSFDQHHWALATAACEHFALAFANIRLRDILREEAIRDPLTGLFNRRYMDDVLRREFEKAAKDGEKMAVLMIDLDHFKAFNDHFGHEAGDMLLRTVGRHIHQHIRTEDAACRYGGEEFTVLLRNSDLEVGLARAEALREGMNALHVAHHRQVVGPITASFGVASIPEHGRHWRSVLRAADAALFRAKQLGRDRVESA